jgi:Domain of unknown function (DUF397)
LHTAFACAYACYDAPCKLISDDTLSPHFTAIEEIVMQVTNGIPATQLPMARWRKSQASNPSGCCVEVAALPDGAIAVRNSRDPAGPALVYTRAEVGAFLTGVKNGEFDDLYPGGSVVLSHPGVFLRLAGRGADS